MLERLRVIERNLLPLVVLSTVVGLAAPGPASALQPVVAPLLALLMLCVSLTFDLSMVWRVLRRPGLAALATALVYGPMSLVALLLARTLAQVARRRSALQGDAPGPS